MGHNCVSLILKLLSSDIEFFSFKIISRLCAGAVISSPLAILTGKNLYFTEYRVQGWLLLTFFLCLHNQLSSFNSIIERCLKNVIHEIDGKNEWLLLSVTFTAKFELVFVLTFENVFS